MEKISGFDFQPIQIDRSGKLTGGAEELAQHVKTNHVTDVVIICHGFRNDENDARALYTHFLTTFADNCKLPGVSPQLAGRTFAVGGVFWPSMIFPEVNDSQGHAQAADSTMDDRLRLVAMKTSLDSSAQAHVDEMLSHLDSAAVDDENAQLKMVASLLSLAQSLPSTDDNEFSEALAGASPEALRNALLAGEAVDVVQPGGMGGGGGIPTLDDETPANDSGARSFLGNVFGFIPKLLNLTTFLLMFHRCGGVGEKGISRTVRRVRELSNTRVHLVGHSLGGRAVTACVKALLDAPKQQVNSMMLLEAAYSHFGLSEGEVPGGVSHPRGFFRDVIDQKAVTGPIVATHSEHDAVVGFAYTAMAAVSLNNARAIGDEKSRFGGIGRNGVLDTREAVKADLNVPGVAYQFVPGKIHNLNGSRKVDGKALIDSHGDVTNAAVTWAFASLVAKV